MRIIIALYLLLSGTAYANHDPGYCQEQSNAAFYMAYARDSGIPIDYYIQRAERLGTAQKLSYRAMVDMIYSNMDTYPERLGAITANQCMNHK